MALQPGETFDAGENQVLVFRFKPTGGRTGSVSFVDLPVAGEVVSVNAEVLPKIKRGELD
ncbi:MAG: hypothetical protein KF868_11075 [Acidobacteria bacterium]|nr:hypothetical protein [Acidobacteriota bacterium]MCW5969844.1 hypothetical protein [Blastocatellales bacterium]